MIARYVILVCALACVMPFFASALTIPELQSQINALLAQITELQKQKTQTTALSRCPMLSRALLRGMKGDDVSGLQIFLKAEGVFNGEATGFFGAITEKSVQTWQAKERLVSRGSPGETGWGIVGPKTQAKISERCAASPEPVSQIKQCSAVATTTPTAACLVAWELVRDTNCNASWKCAVPPKGPNRPPLFHDISGPATLNVGVSGQWSVKAVDPDNDPLTYYISWGEAETALSALEKLAGGSSAFFASGSSFTHTYYSAGSYIINAKVRDPSGKEVQGTATVKVVSPAEPACATCTTDTSAAPAADDYSPQGLVFVPDGVTHCVTPWGGKLVPSGHTVTPVTYFEGSAPVSVQTMKCIVGKWYRCDEHGAQCTVHVPPAENPTMMGLQSYTALVGSQCGAHQSQMTVRTGAGSLLCKDNAGSLGVCAMAQEETAIGLYCAHTNWAESLSL